MALTIRLNNDEEIELRKICEVFEIKTSSGGIKKAITNFLKLKMTSEKLMYDNAMLRNEIDTIKKLILEKRKLQSLVNNKQSQLTRIANK